MDPESKPIINKNLKLRRIIRYIVAVAASVLLVILLVEGYKFYALSPERLFAENYKPFELPVTTKSSDSASSIEAAYRQKHYGEVIKLNRNSVLSLQDVFLTAMAYLETEDYPKAISTYQVVIADTRDKRLLIKDAAEYYMALAYLQNRDYDQAIDLMDSIYNSPIHVYKDKFTRSFINRIKKLKWR